MPVHTFMTTRRIFTAAAQIIFLINLFWSMKKGAKAPANPWEATTLEWTIPSPPPFDNFAGVHPVVNHGPYEYSVPGAPKDFVMQTDPPSCIRGTSAIIMEYGQVTHNTISGRAAASAADRRMAAAAATAPDGRGASRRASFTGLYGAAGGES